MVTSPPTRRRSSAAAGALVAVLAARNLGGLILPDSWYVPTNVAVGGLLVGIARGARTTSTEMGLDRRCAGRGLRLGAVAGGAVAVAMAVAAALPSTRALFEDGRVDVTGGGGELAYQTLVRIPIGTVVFEELAFRGVLLGLARRRLGTVRAVAVSSLLFGLWHIVPSWGIAGANEGIVVGRIGAVVGAVVVTTIGGVVFCALRLRSGHVLAPMLVHLAFNDTGYLLSWWVQS